MKIQLLGGPRDGESITVDDKNPPVDYNVANPSAPSFDPLILNSMSEYSIVTYKLFKISFNKKLYYCHPSYKDAHC